MDKHIKFAGRQGCQFYIWVRTKSELLPLENWSQIRSVQRCQIQAGQSGPMPSCPYSIQIHMHHFAQINAVTDKIVNSVLSNTSVTARMAKSARKMVDKTVDKYHLSDMWEAFTKVSDDEPSIIHRRLAKQCHWKTWLTVSGMRKPVVVIVVAVAR